MEIRTLVASRWLNAFLRWPYLKQVFRLERVRRIGKQETREVVYGLTSCEQTPGMVYRLMSWIRDHWKIENRLHYVRDVTLGEDACRVRRGSSPQVLAAVRNVVNYLLEGLRFPSKAAALRRFASKPGEALRLITDN